MKSYLIVFFLSLVFTNLYSQTEKIVKVDYYFYRNSTQELINKAYPKIDFQFKRAKFLITKPVPNYFSTSSVYNDSLKFYDLVGKDYFFFVENIEAIDKNGKTVKLPNFKVIVENGIAPNTEEKVVNNYWLTVCSDFFIFNLDSVLQNAFPNPPLFPAHYIMGYDLLLSWKGDNISREKCYGNLWPTDILSLIQKNKNKPDFQLMVSNLAIKNKDNGSIRVTSPIILKIDLSCRTPYPNFIYRKGVKSFSGKLKIKNGAAETAVSGKNVSLKRNGKILSTTKTNKAGRFNLAYNESLEGVEFDVEKFELGKTEVLMVESPDGKLSKALVKGKEGFVYTFISTDAKLLQTDFSEDVAIESLKKYSFKGNIKEAKGDFEDKLKSVPVKDLEVKLSDRKNKIYVTKTNESGDFQFDNLDTKENFKVTIDANSSSKYSKLELYNSNGIFVSPFKKNSKGEFEFIYLNTDEIYLSLIIEFEPEMPIVKLLDNQKSDFNFNRKILFSENEYKLPENSKSDLDVISEFLNKNKGYNLEVIGHTDSRGDTEFNLKLSGNRAIEIALYLVKQGVETNRITTTAMGETKLLNKCADGVECTEEEHAANRRVEFKFTKIK